MQGTGEHSGLRSLVLAACGLLAALAAAWHNSAPADAAASALQAGMNAGNFSEFAQTNAQNATLAITGALTAEETAYAAKATYSGTGNGYARGVWNVDWQPGETVGYGAYFYLPAGFHAAMQGQVSLLRWDNFGAYPTSDNDKGGIAIFGSDRKAYLVRTRDTQGQDQLVGPFTLPEGRWFELEVVQRFSTNEPYSEVYRDGELVGASSAPNFYGRPIDRLRVGIVAIDAERQRNPLTLYFDEAWSEPTELGIRPLLPPADQPPTVTLVRPKKGKIVRNGETLTIRANAADDHGVDHVRIFVDGTLKRTLTERPYIWEYKRAAPDLSKGPHRIRAVAFDTAGQRSKGVRVRIKRK